MNVAQEALADCYEFPPAPEGEGKRQTSPVTAPVYTPTGEARSLDTEIRFALSRGNTYRMSPEPDKPVFPEPGAEAAALQEQLRLAAEREGKKGGKDGELGGTELTRNSNKWKPSVEEDKGGGKGGKGGAAGSVEGQAGGKKHRKGSDSSSGEEGPDGKKKNITLKTSGMIHIILACTGSGGVGLSKVCSKLVAVMSNGKM